MKAGYMRELDDDAIETLARYHRGATSPESEIHVHHFGGAVARVDEDETAYGERRRPSCSTSSGVASRPTASTATSTGRSGSTPRWSRR